MPSSLVFTAVTGGVQVTGTFDTGITSVDLPTGDYQLMQMNATQLWLKPLNGGYDIKPFSLANVTTPAAGSLAALKSSLRSLLSPNISSMTPTGEMYVSSSRGNDSIGNGSLDAPYATIAKGITEAEANAAIDGHNWGVRVLPGTYDEQVAPAGPSVTYIVFEGGARLQYSGAGAAFDDTAAPCHVTLMDGAELINTAGGALFAVSQTGNVVNGRGQLITDSASVLVSASGGDIFLYDTNLFGLGNSAELAGGTGGTVRMVGCQVLQGAAVSAFIPAGVTLHLSQCLVQTAHTDYASAGAAQNIQVVDCACNVAAGANITETVGTMLVNAAFTL